MNGQPSNRGRHVAVTAVVALFVMAALAAAAEDAIDWKRARRLYDRSQAGEVLPDDDQAYLERARKERGKRMQQQAAEPRDKTGLVPLNELTEKPYKDQDGGLYGAGSNVPPAEHAAAAAREAAAIVPRNAQGEPAEDGKIVLVSIGMSNTSQEFGAFVRLAADDPQKAGNVVLVNAAQGGRDASSWTDPEGGKSEQRQSVWAVLDERLEAAGVTPQQVQAAWVKHARAMPANLGEFPAHARQLQQDIAKCLTTARKRYPNLRIAYVSSRIYAGYANTALNPEPYAYESAFSVRWLIQDQVKGEPALNYAAERGDVKAPLILWGPYLWADGVSPRQSDGLLYKREDLGDDGTHPSGSGQRKVAGMLLKFFKTEATARPWFAKPEPEATKE